MTLQIFEHDLQPAKHARGVGLGFFDGVHRGHQELLRTLIYESHRNGLVPAVLTFPIHPETILRPNDPFESYLCDLPERLNLMAECGIAETHLMTFDETFAAIAPLDFLNQYLADRLQAKLIVVGHDYRFGHLGAGDITLLQNWADQRDIRVIVVDQVNIGGERISSSRIRDLIGRGDMIGAASLLGRPYVMSGVVVPGRKLGRQMGFPTANTMVHPELACPAYGVYATRTKVGERIWNSITNIGLRPTVNRTEQQPLIETYIFDADLTLYGQTIEVAFLEMMRPEQYFNSLLQLGTQVDQDLKTVRDWHRKSEQCHEKARIGDIPVYLLPTTRFAQAAAHLVFLTPLEKNRASCQALLMRVLTASCRRYPSRTSLATALDSLYGSTIEANQEKQGDLQIINLSADGLIRWTDGSSPFRETCALLFDLLFEPLLDDAGLFDTETFETERQNLILEIAARENDRSKYSYDQCVALYCGDQVQGLSPIGDREILQQITRQDLKAAYDYLLNSASVALYIGGQIDNATLDICLAGLRRMPVVERPVIRPAERPAPFDPAASANVTEHKALEQARIAMAYTGLPPYFSHQSIVVTMLNSMLGGDVHSLLFDVVREKMGLAYSVFSMNQRSLSSLFVMAGVAPDQVTPALTAIGQQVVNLATGEFEPSLFERARQMIETGILSANDDLSTLLSQQIIGRVFGRTMTRSESISLLHAVTPAEVIGLAGRLKLVTCYVLTSDISREGVTT